MRQKSVVSRYTNGTNEDGLQGIVNGMVLVKPKRRGAVTETSKAIGDLSERARVKKERLRRLKNKVRRLDFVCACLGMLGITLGMIEVRFFHSISYPYSLKSFSLVTVRTNTSPPACP